MRRVPEKPGMSIVLDIFAYPKWVPEGLTSDSRCSTTRRHRYLELSDVDADDSEPNVIPETSNAI